MKKTTVQLAAFLMPFFALSSCVSSINMPLDRAKTEDGYVNTPSYDLGHVLVWNTQSGRAERIFKVTRDAVPSASVDTGPRYTTKNSSISRDTKVEISATTTPSDAVKAEATAKFVNSTGVVITNYNPREFRDPSYALNSPELREWRTQLSTEFTDPHFRFVFVSRVTDGDKIDVSRKSSGTVTADANVIEAGQYKFNTSYDNQAAVTISAQQAPLTLSTSVFNFRISGDSYRFNRDTSTEFNFQKVLLD